MKGHIIVVGGGITGLHIAACLRKLVSGRITMITQDIGGLLSSYEDKGFRFDYGGHVYTPEDAQTKNLLIEAGAITHERKAVYLHHEGRVPYPVQDYADKLGIKLQRSKKYDPCTLHGWALNTFGPGFYEKFFNPFNRRVWTMDPIEMSSDWVKDRVKTPQEKKDKWGPNAIFLYAPGTQIIGKLKERTFGGSSPRVELLRGKVDEVDIARKRVYIVPETGHASWIDYDVLFWTGKLKKLSPQVGISADAFLYNRVLSLGIGLMDVVEAFGIEPFHWAYFDVRDIPHRVTLLSFYHHDMAPPGKDSLLVEFPVRWGYRDMPTWVAPILFSQRNFVEHEATHRNMPLRALQGTNIRLRKQDIDTCHVGMVDGYPIQTIGLRQIVAETKRRLMFHGVYTAGRWGSWGYFNINHCFADAEAAVNVAAQPIETNIENYLHARFYYAKESKARK